MICAQEGTISLAKRPGRGKKKAGELFSYICGEKEKQLVLQKRKKAGKLVVHRQKSTKAKFFIKLALKGLWAPSSSQEKPLHRISPWLLPAGAGGVLWL